MQYRQNGNDAVTNCIIFRELLSDKDIKLQKVQEYYLNQYPAANID